jgi:hypothetical protein
MTNLHRARDCARVAPKIGRGLVAFLAGFDKFFHLLADRPGYRSPLAIAVVPVSPRVFMPGAVRKDRGALCGRTLGRVFR